jgi:hypothetical protein
MSSAKSYERVLGALVAEARVGRISRVFTGAQRDGGWERPSGRGGRAWINGKEVGDPDPRFAHLGRSHD